MTPELCIVIPVLNEEGNVAPLVERLRAALEGVAWETIFVDDDSRDATRERVRIIGQADPRVRLLHRIGRRGLSSAFVEGAQASLAPAVAAMDGDLQHDESLLPGMLALLRGGEADLVVGSRYMPGGGLGGWSRRRSRISRLATRVSRLVLRQRVSDPMSGFFMLTRPAFEAAVRRLSAIGFKILLDLLVSSPPGLRVRELPYRFRTRHAGESKLDASVALDYALLILDKLIGHWVPVRFILFALVGAFGIPAHLLVLGLGLRAGFGFTPAQSAATAVAMGVNYLLNNLFTFRDRRLRGRRLVRGFLTFAAICSVGAVGNVGVAAMLFGQENSAWWVAGVTGAMLSLVWNYAASSLFTWRKG